MKSIFSLIFFFPLFILQLLCSLPLKAQTVQTKDTIKVQTLLLYKAKLLQPLQGQYSQSNTRTASIYGVSGLMWGGTLIGLNELWYKNYPKSKFKWYNDFGEWRHIDKAGHIMTGYFESRWLYCMGNWAGVSPRKAAWIGAGLGFSYQLSMELLDGHSANWGFSMPDIAANTLGCGVFLSQQLIWGEQRIRIKFNTVQPMYPQGNVAIDARVKSLYGSRFMERTMKDYNAQVYWLSANIYSFLPDNSTFPKWLNVAVGFSAEGMLGGYSNHWQADNVHYKRYQLQRYSEFILSPDVDLTKIKTDNYFLKMVLEAASIFKFPAPALVLNSNGKVGFYSVYYFNWSKRL